MTDQRSAFTIAGSRLHSYSSATDIDDAEWWPSLPGTARKIGEVQRTAALLDRLLAQHDHGSAGGAVVHVRIHGCALLQTLDQPEILDVVHAAVSRAGRALVEPLPQWVVVLRPITLQFF